VHDVLRQVARELQLREQRVRLPQVAREIEPFQRGPFGEDL